MEPDPIAAEEESDPIKAAEVTGDLENYCVSIVRKRQKDVLYQNETVTPESE